MVGTCVLLFAFCVSLGSCQTEPLLGRVPPAVQGTFALEKALPFSQWKSWMTDTKISYCNHYAVNRGSVAYSPCKASYVVASENNGAILPSGVCGDDCPVTGGGGGADPQTCGNLRVTSYTSNELKLDESNTAVFDQYCDSTRKAAFRCDAVPNAPVGRAQFTISPPTFVATTNWCDPEQSAQPVPFVNRLRMTSQESDYPFSFGSPANTVALGKHSCPGSLGYNAKPVSSEPARN